MAHSLETAARGVKVGEEDEQSRFTEKIILNVLTLSADGADLKL